MLLKMNELKKHKITYFKLKSTSKEIWSVTSYDKSYKEYNCEAMHDMNKEKYLKSNKTVYAMCDIDSDEIDYCFTHGKYQTN